MSGFSRKRNGEILATFSHYEGAILKSLTEQILELLGEGDAPADPLLAVVGISSNDSLPEDPVLARLLPMPMKRNGMRQSFGAIPNIALARKNVLMPM